MAPSRLACLLLLGLSAPAWADIAGLYGTPCLALDGLSAVKDIYLDPAEGKIQIVQTVFSDQLCETPAYDFAFSGTYTLEEGALDLHFTAIELTALDPKIAEAFSAQKLCGIDAWTSEMATDVSGLVCGGQKIPARDSVVFDRVQETEAGGIQLGATDAILNGESPEQRPETFDAMIYSAR